MGCLFACLFASTLILHPFPFLFGQDSWKTCDIHLELSSEMIKRLHLHSLCPFPKVNAMGCQMLQKWEHLMCELQTEPKSWASSFITSSGGFCGWRRKSTCTAYDDITRPSVSFCLTLNKILLHNGCHIIGYSSTLYAIILIHYRKAAS